MKKYIAPEADLICFRPVEALAAIGWEDLLSGQYGDNTPGAAEVESSDIAIKI